MSAETVASVILRMKSEGIAEVDQAAAATRELNQAAGDATSGADELGDAAGRTGQNVQKLAGALSMVSPEASSVAMGLADIADVAEVAAAASKALGISLGSMFSVAGPVAVAMASLALAWKYYADELERAEGIAALAA